MATIREIASRAGVSLGTVDRVLHDRGRVSPETAARIRQVIEELGFTPNLFARHLSTSREYRIGVLMPDPDQDEGYWRMPLKGMQRAVEGLRAYRLSLETAYFDRYKPETFLGAHRRLCEAGVDGILMAPVIRQAALKVLDQPGIPVHVSFDTGIEHPLVSCRIGQDSWRSGRLAARLMLLLTAGGGTVAIVQPDTDNQHTSQRVQGFASAMAEAGRPVISVVRPPRTDRSTLAGVIGGLCGANPDLGGVLMADATTHLAACALADLGRSGIHLIGYDLLAEDVPFLESGAIDFLITQSPVEQGEAGIRQLFNLLVLNQAPEPTLRMPLNIVSVENYPDFLDRC